MKKKTDNIDCKILEEAFLKACEKAEKEVQEARDLAAKADQMVKNISEKYGVPISWNHGEYVPESIHQWKDEKNLSEEEIEYMHELFANNFRFVDEYYDSSYSKGYQWMPSRNC